MPSTTPDSWWPRSAPHARSRCCRPNLSGSILRPDLAVRTLRIGTASWTDPTITKGGVFYPRGVSSSEDRLRYYASQFPVVEVDSTYYSLPERAIATLWAERTPDDFVFHVKAHALMTGQPTEVSRLPEAARSMCCRARSRRSRASTRRICRASCTTRCGRTSSTRSSRCARRASSAASCCSTRDGFCPHRRTRSSSPTRPSGSAWNAGGRRARNRHWYGGADGQGRATQWTLDMLRELGLTHVMVDGPQGLESSVPPWRPGRPRSSRWCACTAAAAATWEAAKVPTVERYRYLYSPAELESWMPKIDEAGFGAGAPHHGVLQQLLRQLRHDERSRARGEIDVARVARGDRLLDEPARGLWRAHGVMQQCGELLIAELPTLGIGRIRRFSFALSKTSHPCASPLSIRMRNSVARDDGSRFERACRWRSEASRRSAGWSTTAHTCHGTPCASVRTHRCALTLRCATR